MCFKKDGVPRRVAAAFAAGAVSALLAASAPGQIRVVNRVAAVVNDRAVTLFDVRIVEAFGLAESPIEGSVEEARFAILNRLVDRKLVQDLARDQIRVDPDRVREEIDRIAALLGEEEMAARLASFGLTRGALRPYVEDKLRTDTFVAERFGRTVTVSLREIEARYGGVYVPGERVAGREPRPLLSVVDLLEAVIKGEKIAGRADLWLLGLRDQAEVEIRPDALK